MDSFKFKVHNEDTVYEATKINNGTTMVSWVDRGAPFACYYDNDDVTQFIKDGAWRVL